MALARSTALGQFVFLTVAFGALIQAFAVSDFSVVNVAANSHSSKPLIYKIAAAWGNHEGSLVLWVWILALYGAGVALFGRNLPAAVPGAGAGGAGADRRGLPRLHAVHLEPVPAPRSGRRSTARASIRSCRTRRSPRIRRCSTRATSASRWPSPSPSPR